MECSISEYLESRKTIKERIIAIDEIIGVMILKLAEVAGGQNSSIEEYQLDDGQMKIRTRYRTVSDVEAGIKSLEKMKQYYKNRLNGAVTFLRDTRSYR